MGSNCTLKLRAGNIDLIHPLHLQLMFMDAQHCIPLSPFRHYFNLISQYFP
jgi:hypothetical protein